MSDKRIQPKDIGVEGEFQYKEERAKLPDDVEIPASVSTMNAQVDATPQKLKTLRPFHTALKQIPSVLPAEAQILMGALFDCFTKQNTIKEGVLKDLIWGFEQGGIPRHCTAKGIKQLRDLGYITIKGPDNSRVAVEADRIEECWMCYEKKMLDLIYE